MTILVSEIKFYKSAVVSDAGANGGRMSIVESVSAVAQNVFPDVPEAERAAGSVKYRKMFVKVENSGNETLSNALLFLHRITPGDDAMRIFAGTQTDTQSGIAGPVLFGVGKLNTTVIATDTQIDVLVEDWAAGAIFADGDTIRISDQTILSGAGNEEIHVINGAPSPAGDVITLTLTNPLTNGFNSANTYIGAGIPLGSIVGTFDTWVETSGLGTFDEATPGNVVVGSIGGVEQNWTITFTSPTAFDLTGDTLGASGSGVVGGNFLPNNPDFSQPYFTLLTGAWGGTWAIGNTITFTTHPAAVPVWYERTVPAAAAALSANFIDSIVVGESA